MQRYRPGLKTGAFDRSATHPFAPVLMTLGAPVGEAPAGPEPAGPMRVLWLDEAAPGRDSS